MGETNNNVVSQKSPLGDLGVSTPPLGGWGLIRGIIFDLDGTLLDSIEDIANSNNMMLQKNGFPPHPVEQYVDWIGNGAGQLVRLSLPDEIANNEQQFSAYLNDYKNEYKKNLFVNSVLYNGIPELLRFLNEKNIPMAVNTNKPHEQSMLLAEHFFKPYCFKLIQGQKDDVPGKPDPEGANIIAKHFNIDASEIAYIGDSVIDILTAKAAGMQSIGVSWGYGTPDEMIKAGCEHLMGSTDELKTFIEERI
jgi:phosphoglycolate phosphatase